MSKAILEPFEAFGITELSIEVDAQAAVDRLAALYEQASARLKDAFIRYAVAGEHPGKLDAYYPYVGIKIQASELNLDARLSFGALHDPGDLWNHGHPTQAVFSNIISSNCTILQRITMCRLWWASASGPFRCPILSMSVAAAFHKSARISSPICSRCRI